MNSKGKILSGSVNLDCCEGFCVYDEERGWGEIHHAPECRNKTITVVMRAKDASEPLEVLPPSGSHWLGFEE